MKQLQKKNNRTRLLLVAIALLAAVSGIFFIRSGQGGEDKEVYQNIPSDDDFDKIENGIHLRTGLIAADGLTEVVNNCTTCHSAQLVTQNRMSRERWVATIRWMQKTQNLWDLGANEEIIINYLVTNYPPLKKGRRAALTDIEWYALEP